VALRPGYMRRVREAQRNDDGTIVGKIDDMDLLRDGAMETLLSGVRAPSTPGSHLCSYKWGNVRQLDKAHRGGDC
jgi:hypothetical protein